MYQAREDSYFLSEILKNYLKNLPKKEKQKIIALDLGTGSCIQAETMRKEGIKNIACSDIDKEAIKTAKEKNFKAIYSSLFEKIKGKFNLIAFNAPYLPESRYDRQKDTSGGKEGNETILKFLRQVRKHLKKQGKIFLLFSSFTPKARILKEIRKQQFKIEKTYEKNLFFEKLFIYSLSS